jgi:hypothetical protein
MSVYNVFQICCIVIFLIVQGGERNGRQIALAERLPEWSEWRDQLAEGRAPL